MEAGALLFSQAARRLGAAARAAGLEVPAFRCPPRLAGAERTVRRYPGGSVVSVRMRGRPFADVLADMVQGVVVVNRLADEAARNLRPMLASAADPAAEQPRAA